MLRNIKKKKKILKITGKVQQNIKNGKSDAKKKKKKIQ